MSRTGSVHLVRLQRTLTSSIWPSQMHAAVHECSHSGILDKSKLPKVCQKLNIHLSSPNTDLVRPCGMTNVEDVLSRLMLLCTQRAAKHSLSSNHFSGLSFLSGAVACFATKIVHIFHQQPKLFTSFINMPARADSMFAHTGCHLCLPRQKQGRKSAI